MKREGRKPSDRTKTFVADESLSFEVSGETSPADEKTVLWHDSARQREPRSDEESKSSVATGASKETKASSGKTRQFGRYALLELLGSGGMGEVHRALHVRLRKQVAIKVLTEHRGDDKNAQQRFSREVRMMCGLDHPNLVRLETAGQQDGIPYLVMEFVAGIDLQRLLKRVGPLAIADACQLIGQAAVGLDHLHQHRIIHRDIKPSNLIVTHIGVVKVVDLGMARQSDSQQELTPAGRVVGNAHYIAPESIDPDRDPPTPEICGDVYSLGCTLFTLLAGHPPFQSAEPELTDILQAKVRCEPPRLEEFRSELAHGLSDVVASMIARDPRDRIATPMQVVAMLAPFAVGCDIPALLRRADATKPSVDKTATTMDTAEYLQRCAEDSGEMARLMSQRSRPRQMFVGAALLLAFCGLFVAWMNGSFSAAKPLPSLSAKAAPPAGIDEAPLSELNTGADVGERDATPVPYDVTSLRDHHLLASIEPARDAFDLDVRQTSTGYLLSNLRGRGILQVPVKMPEWYTLDFTVERMGGQGSFGIGFSAGGGRLLALLDHKVDEQHQSGMFYAVSSGKANIPDAYSQPLLPADTAVQMRLKVTPGRVQLLRRSSDGAGEEPAISPISMWLQSSSASSSTTTPNTDDKPAGPHLASNDAYYPGILFIQAYQGSFRVSDVIVRDSETVPTPQPFVGIDSATERRLAERIVWRGGHVKITTDDGDKTVKVLKDLTDDPWLIEVERCTSAPGMRIGDTTLLQLSKIKGLQKLDLVASDVTSEGLAAIAGMKDLRMLSLGGRNLDASSLASLRDLPQLRHLQLISMPLSPESLAELEKFPQLTMFCLTSSSVTDDDVDAIVKWLPKLQHFCLSGTKISGSCLASLTALRDLEELQLNGTQVNDDEIAVLAQLPKLKLLGLARTEVSQAAIETLRKQLPELQVQP